jgi:hypothetical protein
LVREAQDWTLRKVGPRASAGQKSEGRLRIEEATDSRAMTTRGCPWLLQFSNALPTFLMRSFYAYILIAIFDHSCLFEYTNITNRATAAAATFFLRFFYRYA